MLLAGKGFARGRESILLSDADDARAGREAAKQVAAEIGLLPDPKLDAYVQGIGRKLLRGVPRRGFDYHFEVVDQTEPNAFTLPGGYIFIARGLLALANNEDELACVMGHEITHAVRRHAARAQAIARRESPLAMPWVRAARQASYGRDMEREADEGGQRLCAAAGYDPVGMATFLRSLERYGRLRTGQVRGAFFLDSHPGSRERAGVNKVRASEIRWRRDPRIGDPRAALLRHLDGLPVGQRPEAGVFQGQRFLHREQGFEILFPSGWQTANTNRAVGATEPRGDAVVFLTAAGPPQSLEAVAEEFVKQQKGHAEVHESKPVKLLVGDAWRLELDARTRRGAVGSLVTFFAWRGSVWQVTGMSSARQAGKFRGRWLATARSFRPLTPEHRRSIVSQKLRIVKARAQETLQQLGLRTHNAWSVSEIAVANALQITHRFQGGELVKITRVEP